MNKKLKIIITTLIFILCIHTFNVKEVSAAPDVKVKMSDKKVTIDVGKTKTIKAKVTAGKKVNKAVRWSSTDRKVASVDSNGKIKALRTGRAVIKATSKANKKIYAQCIVEVVINDTNKLKYENVSFIEEPFKNKVIKSYDELQECKAELEKLYIDTRGVVYFQPIKEKIETYNEDYFKNNVLYLQSYAAACKYDLIGKIERVRKTSGKYIMRITITYMKFDKPVHYPAINTAEMVFVEAPRSYLKRIDKVQFKFES